MYALSMNSGDTEEDDMKGKIREYGEVEFDPIDLNSNYYDLYDVAICDPETDLIVSEEHYATKDDYLIALRDTYGREVMDEQIVMGFCDVIWDCDTFECECTHHVAYVIDHEE